LMALLLAGPERSPDGAERRACQQQRMPISAPVRRLRYFPAPGLDSS
jgi:hypothetical protein